MRNEITQIKKSAYLANVKNDFAKLPAIEDAIEKIKAELIAQSGSASSGKKYEKTGDILQWSFSRIVSHFEYFKTETQNRSFAGIQENDYVYQNVVRLLDKLNQKMEELRTMDAA